jgi:hypothetical protein
VIIVQKYGGTSVGSVELIKRAADRIIACKAQGHEVAVVVSAMGLETDRLVDLAQAIQARPDPREMDVLLAAGEQVSIALVAMALKERGCNARSYLADQVPIHTEAVHSRARITHVETERLRADLAAGIVPVVAGFQGVDAHGNVTTLGRGGSDTTCGCSRRRARRGRMPDPLGCRGGLHDGPTSRSGGTARAARELRGNARAREPGLEDPSDPRRRVRGQAPHAAARDVERRRQRRHAHRGRRGNGGAARLRRRLQRR